MTPPQPAAAIKEGIDQSPHYVRALAEMGEHRRVVADEDIFAANGMKLLAKGARISGRDHERLSLHKLRTPLDLVLSAEDAVDCPRLLADLDLILSTDALIAGIAARCGDLGGMRLGLASLVLPAALRLRLTVMRDQRYSLYAHSLRVAVISYAMAHCLRFAHQEKVDLLLASLCHDMGELHTDPALLDPAHEITQTERRFIDVHPLTAHLLLCDMPGMPPPVVRAVLEHHERLDGSGYPNRLDKGAIGRLGQVLAIAEVMEAVGRRDGLGQLDIVLRLGHGRLDTKATNVLRGLIQIDPGLEGGAAVHGDIAAMAGRVSAALACWKQLENHPVLGSLDFLRTRMNMLRSGALESGIDPYNTAPLVALAQEDPQVATELKRALSELVWRMVDLGHEMERRASAFSGEAWPAVQPLLAALRGEN